MVGRSPSAAGAYLCALDHLLGPAADIVIAGTGDSPVTAGMLAVLDESFLPSVTIHLRSESRQKTLDVLAPFTRDMEARNGNTTAYLCSGHTCREPVYSSEALRELLGEEKKIRGS